MDLRCFFALRLDAGTRDRLAAVADRLRAWDLPARWTHTEDLHLTVAYVGLLPEVEARCLPYAVEDVASAFLRPRLALAGLAAEGTSGEVPARVQVAVADAEGACVGLHRDLSECLDDNHDRAYRPHITLARPLPLGSKHRELPLFRDWPHLLEAHAGADWGVCGVDALVLYTSHSERTLRHEALATWSL